MLKGKSGKTKYSKWTALLLAIVIVTNAGCSSAEAGLFKNDKWADELYEQALSLSGDARFAAFEDGLISPESDVRENDRISFDCSCVSRGFIIVRLKSDGLNKIKIQVTFGDDVSTYVVNPGKAEVYPLVHGSGEYKISAFENVQGTKYALVMSETLDVRLEDDFSPFLLPNQYVNYAEAPVTRALAELISQQEGETLARADLTFRFVLAHMDYDKQLAQTVKDGYVPELDKDLERGKGICFDYASLMTAIMRCMNIPCKLVTGYAGSAYHAWISVWSESEGWIDKLFYFDGKGWQRVDPTFADVDDASGAIKEYVGDGSNYIDKHYY